MTCAQTTLCLLSERKVLQWGITLNSECKDSLSPDYFPSSPFYIYGNIEGQHPVAKIACGKNFCILSDVSGQVFTWGGNEFGQLGHGDKMSKSAPQIVNHLKNEFIVKVDANSFHTLALDNTGLAYTWGKCQEVAGKKITDSFGSVVNYQNHIIYRLVPRKLAI